MIAAVGLACLTIILPLAASGAPAHDGTAIRSFSPAGQTIGGEWSGEALDTAGMSRGLARNPRVAALMGRDRDDLPQGFDPEHATGDSGNAYPYSQCTWWAYLRRHQLGLPAGSYFGDGADWAESARRLGYWVDRTPRQGDIMVFRRGQNGASPVHGHVAIVEKVNKDGSVSTSECGASYHGRPFHRIIKNTGDYRYIHY